MARRLGLLAVVRDGVFGSRTRMLVGERGEYLVAIAPSHSLNASSVDILVRYPQGHTVRGLQDDLRRKVRWRRRKQLFVGDGSVLQRMPYALFPPTAGAVERATDELVAAMRDHVRPLDRLCEGCGVAHDLGLFMADGVPGVYCEKCVTNFVRGEEEFAETFRHLAPEYSRGVWIGVVAALAFGLALGSLASLAVVYGGQHVTLFATPVFFAIGYLTSAFASRGFIGSSIASTLAKLPLALLAVPVATTTMTAVGTMTLHPAEWNLVFIVWSLVTPFRSSPKAVAMLAAAVAVGWLVESAIWTLARWRPKRRTRVERVEREPHPEAP
jgi:hypothetical protein